MPWIERGRPRCQQGFTLIEAVMAIAITGVVITVVSVFIVPATNAYFASAQRAQLGDQADTALRRITRDLAQALPNSARVSPSGLSLELIPVSGAARYAVNTAAALQFGVAPIPTFAIIGPPLRLSGANQKLAWFNLGPATPDADAYTLNNVRTASTAAGNAASVTVTGAALPNALQAPPYRVYAIESPVTYRCDLTARTLTRYTGYGFLGNQPDPPAGGSSAVLARNVDSCKFGFDPSAVAARYALVTVQLALQDKGADTNGEIVSLYHAVHVDNLP